MSFLQNQAKSIVIEVFFLYIINALYEPVAQLVEQRPFKAWAVRSNRTGFTYQVQNSKGKVRKRLIY